MGGKRSDQYQIDHGEAGSTDYKNFPGEKIHDRDKMKVAQTKADDRDELIPRRGENPALADLRARRDAERAAERANASNPAADQATDPTAQE